MITAVADDLTHAREAFAAWRSEHGRGRLPESLWALALDLLDRHSVAEVARELRLNQARLRAKRSEVKRFGSLSPKSEPPVFARFTQGPLSLGAHETNAVRAAIERADGARLCVTLGPNHSDALTAVCAAFLRGAP